MKLTDCLEVELLLCVSNCNVLQDFLELADISLSHLTSGHRWEEEKFFLLSRLLCSALTQLDKLKRRPDSFFFFFCTSKEATAGKSSLSA